MLNINDGLDVWWEEGWRSGILEPFTASLGAATLGMLLAGAIIVGMWIETDDIAMPSVLTMLLGGVLFGLLPGPAASVAWGVLVVGLTAGLLAAARTWVLD